jgi:hypothetical protein
VLLAAAAAVAGAAAMWLPAGHEADAVPQSAE